MTDVARGCTVSMCQIVLSNKVLISETAISLDSHRNTHFIKPLLQFVLKNYTHVQRSTPIQHLVFKCSTLLLFQPVNSLSRIVSSVQT